MELNLKKFDEKLKNRGMRKIEFDGEFDSTAFSCNDLFIFKAKTVLTYFSYCEKYGYQAHKEYSLKSKARLTRYFFKIKVGDNNPDVSYVECGDGVKIIVQIVRSDPLFHYPYFFSFARNFVLRFAKSGTLQNYEEFDDDRGICNRIYKLKDNMVVHAFQVALINMCKRIDVDVDDHRFYFHIANEDKKMCVANVLLQKEIEEGYLSKGYLMYIIACNIDGPHVDNVIDDECYICKDGGVFLSTYEYFINNYIHEWNREKGQKYYNYDALPPLWYISSHTICKADCVQMYRTDGNGNVFFFLHHKRDNDNEHVHFRILNFNYLIIQPEVREWHDIKKEDINFKVKYNGKIEEVWTNAWDCVASSLLDVIYWGFDTVFSSFEIDNPVKWNPTKRLLHPLGLFFELCFHNIKYFLLIMFLIKFTEECFNIKKKMLNLENDEEVAYNGSLREKDRSSYKDLILLDLDEDFYLSCDKVSRFLDQYSCKCEICKVYIEKEEKQNVKFAYIDDKNVIASYNESRNMLIQRIEFSKSKTAVYDGIKVRRTEKDMKDFKVKRNVRF